MRRKKYSELPYAQEFSKEIGVPSIANKVDAEQFFEANRLIQWYLDEPMPTRRKFRFTFGQNARSTSRSCFPAKVPMNCLAATPCTARRFTLWITSIRCPKRCVRPQAQWHPNCRTLRGKHFLVRGAEEPWQRYMRANYVFLDPAERDRCLKRTTTAPPGTVL